MVTFPEWLQAQIDARGWDQAELARRSRTTTATISRLLSGSRNPGTDICKLIADALRLPVDEVFVAAGLLPSKPEDDRKVSELKHIYNTLDENRQDEFVKYGRWQLELQEEENKRDGKHKSNRRDPPPPQ